MKIPYVFLTLIFAALATQFLKESEHGEHFFLAEVCDIEASSSINSITTRTLSGMIN